MLNVKLFQWVSGILAVVLIVVALQYIVPEQPAMEHEPVIDYSDEEITAALLKEADVQNITASERDINRTIASLLLRSNMTREEFHDFVSEQHGDFDVFRTNIVDNVRIMQLIEANVDRSSIEVLDEDVDAFIADNPEIFPAAQIEDSTFKEQFYRLAKQQIYQNKQNQLVSEYIESVMSQ